MRDENPPRSIIVVVFNMQREAPRTLFILTADYQNIAPDWYEVLVVDNGSTPPLGRDTVLAISEHFKYVYLEPDHPSLAHALNAGARLARGRMLGFMIDGARMLSPGVVQYAIRAARAYQHPVVSTVGFHLGPKSQQASTQEGYNQEQEDQLLNSVDWRRDGYALFQIAAFAGSSRHGWFAPLAESNCVFVTRSTFEALGGFDEAFDYPGGGLVNLDFYRRACERPETELVLLLGEGSFHQYHGGATTGPATHETASSWGELAAQYRRIRGRDYRTPRIRCNYLGHVPPSVYPSVRDSLDRLDWLSQRTLTVDGLYDEHPILPNPVRAEKARRQAIVVLGMHRSGTSALTRVVNLMGAALPGNLLPSVPDNEPGYWESYDVLRLNNALLAAAGTAWHDDAPVLDAWWVSEAAQAFRPRARALLEDAFYDTSLFVLKDPRLCRLLPFWKSVLEDFGAHVCFIHILRHPQEVFRSLAARARREETRPAAITVPEKAHLLWLRYVLEAEYQTRGCRRSVITYDGLLADWATTLERVMAEMGLSFPITLDEAAPAVGAFLSPQHKRQQRDEAEAGLGAVLAEEVYGMFAAHAATGIPLDQARLDGVRNALDAVEAAYAPLRAPTRLAVRVHTPWYAEVLDQVALRAPGAAGPAPRVLYVSGNPTSRGHVYRVVHHVAALQAAGIDASWVPLTEAVCTQVDDVDLVVVFRAAWDDLLERLHARCRARGLLLGFDIDDLLFEPEIMTVAYFDYLRSMNEAKRQVWRRKAEGYRRTLTEADFALVSTEPLAEAARALGKPVYVLPNGLDAAMIAQADAALADPAAKPSAGDGRIRLGYASGTPTHQKDFAVVAPVLAALLDERPALRLTVVGYLTLEEFPDLLRRRHRIEIRPHVPHAELFREYARFDVNLAPLECGNPFCEGKSELKYFEAALVAAPTIAAATLPYRTAIKDGETGFCACTPEQWRAHLLALIDDPGERARLGRNARIHAVAAFGPEAQRAAARRTFLAIAQNAR